MATNSLIDEQKQVAPPIRLSGADILRDLSEMSQCADRIDSILDQQEQVQSSRSHSRSVSPFKFVETLEEIEFDGPPRDSNAESNDDNDNDEVD